MAQPKRNQLFTFSDFNIKLYLGHALPKLYHISDAWLEFNLQVIFLNTTWTLRDIIPIRYHTLPRRSFNGSSKGRLYGVCGIRSVIGSGFVSIYWTFPYLPSLNQCSIFILFHPLSARYDLAITASLLNYTKLMLLPCTYLTRCSYENSFNLHDLHKQNMVVTCRDITSHYLIERCISLNDRILIRITLPTYHLNWTRLITETTQFIRYFTCPMYPSILTYDIFFYSDICHQNLPPILWK